MDTQIDQKEIEDRIAAKVRKATIHHKIIVVFMVIYTIAFLIFFGKELVRYLSNEDYIPEEVVASNFIDNKEDFEELKTITKSSFEKDGLGFVGNHSDWRFKWAPKDARDRYTSTDSNVDFQSIKTDSYDEIKESVDDITNRLQALDLLFSNYIDIGDSRYSGGPEFLYKYESFNEEHLWYYIYLEEEPENHFSSECNQPLEPVASIEKFVAEGNQKEYCLYDSYNVYQDLGDGWYLWYVHRDNSDNGFDSYYALMLFVVFTSWPSILMAPKMRWQEVYSRLTVLKAYSSDKAVKFDDPELVQSIKKNFLGKRSVLHEVDGDKFWLDVEKFEKRRRMMIAIIAPIILIGAIMISVIFIMLNKII